MTYKEQKYTLKNIRRKVKSILSDSTGYDSRKMRKEYSVVTELGADSIDLVDITIRLEDEFPMNINLGDMFPDFNSLVRGREIIEEEFDRFGYRPRHVTQQGLEELKRKCPQLNLEDITEDKILMNEINERITVEYITTYISSHINQSSE